MGRNDEMRIGAASGRFIYARSYQPDIEEVTAAAVADAHQRFGGSSVNVHTSEIPQRGFMVGGHPGVPAKIYRKKDVTPEEVQKNRDRIRRVAPSPETHPEVYAGTWYNAEGDRKTYMDASDRIEGEEEAGRLQEERKELEVYHLDTGESVDLRKKKKS